MQFTKETNERQQIHNQEFKEYAYQFEGVNLHDIAHTYMAHKIAELELKIESLQKPDLLTNPC